MPLALEDDLERELELGSTLVEVKIEAYASSTLQK